MTPQKAKIFLFEYYRYRFDRGYSYWSESAYSQLDVIEVFQGAIQLGSIRADK